MTPALRLIRSGHAENGQSMWHTLLGESPKFYITYCNTELPKDNSTIIPIIEYIGGRRISMCSYCLREM